MNDPRANPLAGNRLVTRDDVAQAVLDLYEPTIPYLSPSGARARLGSFGAVFEQESAELEGFARPLYGIVPLTAGGGSFPHWDRVRRGLAAGSDPASGEYWGTIERDSDQRMVEQAAIGLALAFCPDEAWEPLDPEERSNLVRWLHGIFEHQPAPNNWQFFRVLVALGLERVGAPLDHEAVSTSLDLLEGWRVGDHWYVDGALSNVDYYVPMAFHTYGLMYAAANDLGLGDDRRAEVYRERAEAFAADFVHWFGPDGAAIAMGRSLTYRFATASFWSALAWADVEPAMGWGAAKGMLLRNLRWWSRWPISDRDGVLSVGYGYDNRNLCESYNSAGSPYWAMKSFAALAAGPDHPFWRADEGPQPRIDAPEPVADIGWVLHRDREQAVALVGRTGLALDWPEQASAKYRKFSWSSAFAFAGERPDTLGRVSTDSMLAFTDDDGHRVSRLGIDDAGIDGDVVWTTWRPFLDVRVDSACWFTGEGTAHGRLHRVRTERSLDALESGFAVGCTPTDVPDDLRTERSGDGLVEIEGVDGRSGIRSIAGSSAASCYRLAVNAHLLHPHTAVPVLRTKLEPGDHTLGCIVWAGSDPAVPVAEVPERVRTLLDRIVE